MQYIIGGTFRGRRLVTLPQCKGIRPTLGHIRESIFNIIVHRFQNSHWLLSGARVADVFAGTGAMGFEALSRGAAHVTFIDHALTARNVIDANRHFLGVEDISTILVKNVLNIQKATQKCDLIFLDSPYQMNTMMPAVLSRLRESGWLAQGALCVVEHLACQTFQFPTGFELLSVQTYGRVQIFFLLVLRSASI